MCFCISSVYFRLLQHTYASRVGSVEKPVGHCQMKFRVEMRGLKEQTLNQVRLGFRLGFIVLA
jgi:hypothetical protein